MKKLRGRNQAGLVFDIIDDDLIFACYRAKEDVIVLDAKKLGELIAEKVCNAGNVGVDLGDPENVWISKFTSIMSHENIHKMLAKLEGQETSRGFDRLYLAEFMEKIPENSTHVVLWSDAFEACPIGDTWFS